MIKDGAKLIKILKVRHYDNRLDGKRLFGSFIETFDRIKLEGEREGNDGKRAFVKISKKRSNLRKH